MKSKLPDPFVIISFVLAVCNTVGMIAGGSWEVFAGFAVLSLLMMLYGLFARGGSD